jgi:DNA-binding CsgD family transcriptional regulator/nucleoside-triphosphatase THEP1
VAVAVAAVIAREEELALIEDRLDALPAGGASAVLIEGEPGIGKTTVLTAALDAARNRAYHVLACGAAASEVQLSYAALGDLLERLPPGAGDALPPPQRRALDVALRIRDAESESDLRTIGIAVLNVLRGLAREAPVVLAIDDVQWLDRPTATVVEFVTRRLNSEPVLLLLTRRPASDGAPLGLSRLGDGRLARLTIGPLSLGALHRLLQERLEITFRRPLLVKLHEASGGNPFYGLELARALATREGDVPIAEPLPLPPTLAELVNERLATLPAPTRRVLETAAALTEPTVAAVAVAAALDEDEVADAADAAVGAGVITVDGDRIRFEHPLLAASAYAQVTLPRRRDLHRRLAGLVVDPEARARHLALAADGPAEDAAVAAEEAAHRASARGAPVAALDLAELAIRLTPQHASDLHRRKLAAASYAIRATDRRRAEALLEELRDDLPPGPERADVLRSLAFLSMTHEETQLRFLEQARAEASGDPLRLSRIHHGLGECWFNRGEGAAAVANSRQALALAEAAGDRDGTILGTTELLLSETFTGGAVRDAVERAVALARDGDDPFRTFGLREALALTRLCQGRLDDARALLAETLADAAAHGDEGALVRGHALLAQIEAISGDLPAAARSAHVTHDLMPQLRSVQHPWPMYASALVDVLRGASEEARQTAAAALAISERGNLFHGRIQHQSILGMLELARGDATAADRIFRPMIEEFVERGWSIAAFPFGRDAPEALIRVGDLEYARTILDRYDDEVAALESRWLASCALRFRGLLAAAEGDVDAAVESFEAAEAEQAANGWRYDRGRTLLSLGQTLRRAKRKRAARETLQLALALFEELGMPLWAEQARDELASISGRAPATGELTPTEERVAALVAGGRTNREAAAALHLSPHTVEGHLSRIYAKLGVRSRTELANRLSSPN